MDDDAMIQRIDELVAEEHTLHGRASSGHPLSDADRERLRQLEVQLDQCWDLLRRRRALRDAGQDPDGAIVRDESVVERYRQ
jgi:hypothetical protein